MSQGQFFSHNATDPQFSAYRVTEDGRVDVDTCVRLKHVPHDQQPYPTCQSVTIHRENGNDFVVKNYYKLLVGYKAEQLPNSTIVRIVHFPSPDSVV